mmetsp:Transcript_1083/g.4106  ORF Transcript_1083/g.4106 Transcript_1083/m.4106 type:complete len:359 (+) Transcript_1083:110-1186(+)
MGPWRRRPRQKEDPRCSARSHNGAELHQAAAVGHALDIVVTKVRQDEGLHDLGDEGEEGPQLSLKSDRDDIPERAGLDDPAGAGEEPRDPKREHVVRCGLPLEESDLVRDLLHHLELRHDRDRLEVRGEGPQHVADPGHETKVHLHRRVHQDGHAQARGDDVQQLVAPGHVPLVVHRGLQGGVHEVDDEGGDGKGKKVQQGVVVALEESAADHPGDEVRRGVLLGAEAQALAALLLEELAHQHEDAEEVDDLHGDENDVDRAAEDPLDDREGEREEDGGEEQGPERGLAPGRALHPVEDLVRGLPCDASEPPARGVPPSRGLHDRFRPAAAAALSVVSGGRLWKTSRALTQLRARQKR